MLSSFFSTKDLILVGLIFFLPPLVFNLSMHFLQDILLSLALYYLLGLLLAPIVIKAIVGKDPYTILTFKSLGASDSKGKSFTLFLAITLIVTGLLNLLGVWFRLLPGFNSLTSPAPYFNHVWINYIYLVLVLVVAYVVIYFEHKLYYGVVSTLLPDNIIGTLGIVFYQTIHYIGFAFCVMNSSANAVYLLLLIAGMYLCLYLLKEKEDYKSSGLAHTIIFVVNYLLLAIFVILRSNHKWSKGIAYGTLNRKNIWNRIF